MVGTFIGIKPVTGCAKRLHEWCRSVGIEKPVDSHDIHCTIIIKKNEPFDHEPFKYDPPIIADPKTYRFGVFGPNKDCLVLRFESPDLEQRHHMLRRMHDIEWDYDDYHPHLTLTYFFDIDMPKQCPDFPIVFRNEYSKPFEANWRPPEPTEES